MLRQLLVLDKAMLRKVSRESPADYLVPGCLTILWAALVALLVIRPINDAFPNKPETSVVLIGLLFAVLLAFPPGVYLLLRRREARPDTLGLVVVSTVAVLLSSVYLYWVSFYVLFPADILMWSESDFVNDILKFRLGYPIYTAQQNNESFFYPPGAQLLTYLLAWLSGNPLSIPVYRMIQVGYDLLATVVAVLCCRRIIDISLPPRRLRNARLFGTLSLPILFLIATNSLTNPFVHNLHNDALAQLVAIVAYWLLLEYVSNRDRRLLLLMAIIPAIGFLVKQNEAVWALFFSAQLAFFDRPRSLRRLVGFILVSFSALAATVAGGYFIWGEDFIYWIFVIGKVGVSPLRSFEHGLQVWPYFVIGLLGGAALLRGKNLRPLLGPWLVWLTFISLGVWTSGIQGMLNHIGPGSLIAGVWFLVGLSRVWPINLRVAGQRVVKWSWLHAALGTATLLLIFSGLGVTRIPVRPFGDAPHKYVVAIEREFAEQPAKDVLLDMGTWVYVKDGVVMKDRAPSIAERGYNETGNFSGILQRLAQKRYAKILIHDLDAPYFWYDYYKWRKSSGIKQALLENYREIGRIPAVSEIRTQGFGEISILVPRSE